MSAESIESMHKAFLPLLKPDKPGQNVSIRRDDRDPNGWALLLPGKDEAEKSWPGKSFCYTKNWGVSHTR